MPITSQPPSPPSTAVEDYLKAIYSLAKGTEGTVSTTALAERLELTPGSVSAMLRRLAELELLTHEPYYGVQLTEAGRRVALRTVRKHRLVELFLVEVLELPWDRVHDEAERLEHAVSDELAEAISAKLGHPAFDPHGDPIPDAQLEVVEMKTGNLSEVDVGEAVRLVRVSDAQPEMLRYLAERGISPGVQIEILEKQPFGGPLTVSVAGAPHALGLQLAEAMQVSAL